MIRKPNSSLQPVVAGVRVTRSLYDTVIPVIQGRCRVPYLMIWTGNFQAHQSDSKKGKSSKKGGGTVTTYTANFDFLIGYAPVISFGTLWRNRELYWSTFIGSQQFQMTGTGQLWQGVVSNSPGPFVNIIAVTWEQPIPETTFNDYGSGGPVVVPANTYETPLYNSFYTPFFSVDVPGSGQNYCAYGGVDTWNPSNLNSSGPGDPRWSVYIDNGATNPVINVYYMYWPAGHPNWISATNYYPEYKLGMGNEWDYPGGNVYQITYPEFFGIATFNWDMGATATPPNDTVEVVCMNNYSKNGDVNPADFILDIVTSGNYWPLSPTISTWSHGLGFLPSNNGTIYSYAPNILADPPYPPPDQRTITPTTNVSAASLGLTSFRNYCNAYAIWLSGSMDSQRTAADWINDLSELANFEVVWNGSKLNIIPRCEVSAIGWGSIYTAPTSSGPIYTIDDSVFIANPGEDPVIITRNEGSDPRSIPNLVRVQHKSRATGFYSDTTTTWRDETSMIRYGVIAAEPKNWPLIQDEPTALLCAGTYMKRKQMIEPVKISFKLPISHCLLDCYDLVELKDSVLFQVPWGTDSTYPVRLTSMEEDDQRIITCESEPFIYGAHCPNDKVTPPSTINSGYGSGSNAVVSTLVNTPIIFEPVSQLTNSTEQIWIAVSDTDPNYGGCNVYMSSDGGNTYTFLGAMVGQSTMGSVYNSTYPSSPDPDATDTLYVDLTESVGVLSSFSAAQRDSFVPLCYLAPGGTSTINTKSATIPYELISYTTSTLVTANKYSLPPTIRRGVYQTPDVSHAVSQAFAYIGPGSILFKYNLNPSLIGTTLYFKFAAFNTTGRNPQDLSTVTPYSFTPTGLGMLTSPPSEVESYTLNPPIVLYQGKAGGWPGVASGSSSWTDSTKVYVVEPITVTWSDGTSQVYNPPTPNAIPGSPPETLYGAIYDPARTGADTFYLSTTDYSTQIGYISLGSIVIVNESTGGAWGSGGSISEVIAGESISAGAFVYVDSTGLLRNANWASGGHEAIGFVLASYTTGELATIYTSGANSSLASLTVGSRYYGNPATPGAVTATVPTGVGVISQFLGHASTTTMLETDIVDAIILAG